MLCSHCSKDVRQLRVGLCGACYARKKRNGTPEYSPISKPLGISECSFCKSSIGPFVKGLCKACYYREKKNGDLEYRKIPKFCEVPSCDGLVVAHGLCGKHNQRLQRLGTTDAPDLTIKGAKRSHPAYSAWRWMRRSARIQSGYIPAWDDFWKFLEDVGAPPSSEHRFRRLDKSKPYDKDNSAWVVPTLDVGELATNADRQKVWRAAYELKNPRYFKNQYLKKYGIDIDQFEKMLREQNGVCAICAMPETAVHAVSGEARQLAVDHCHTSGKVRALLCTQCNRGLGYFDDSIERLQSAIAYLEKSQA